MFKAKKFTVTPAATYAMAWLIYMLFAFFAFPIFSISVMLFSVALSMFGAWLYGYSGGIVTTALSIPFHYFMLIYYSDDPAIWHEAFNLFGISTQLLASSSVALLRNTKNKLERLNSVLEERVEERTEELARLQHYIVQNHETAQVLLSHMLLGDIGESLSDMLNKSDILLNRLVFKGDPASFQAARLNEMIKDSIDNVQNLEFVDHFFTDKQSGFAEAVREVVKQFTETAGTRFDLKFHIQHDEIPKYVQHQLYRIAREAITNAIRHGNAKNIRIQLTMDDDAYRLSIVNDGLPLPSKIESGLGLKLMQHRTQQLGGDLKWDTTPNGNTRLLCRIPQTMD